MMTNPHVGADVLVGPLLAYKVARLLRTSDGTISFGAAGVGLTYGAADSAQCVNDGQHVPPHPGCTCGFYAWRSRDVAVGTLGEECVATLEVELWGRFHEYDYGYVAAAQNVLEVAVYPSCIECLLIGVEQPARALQSSASTNALLPVCEAHYDESHGPTSLYELSRSLGVEVRWARELRTADGAARWLGTYAGVPAPRQVRRLDELLPGEVAYIFQNAIAEDADGELYVNPLARLIQPLPGTDLPIRLAEDGMHEVLVSAVRERPRWRPRGSDVYRFALPVRVG